MDTIVSVVPSPLVPVRKIVIRFIVFNYSSFFSFFFLTKVLQKFVFRFYVCEPVLFGQVHNPIFPTRNAVSENICIAVQGEQFRLRLEVGIFVLNFSTGGSHLIFGRFVGVSSNETFFFCFLWRRRRRNGTNLLTNLSYRVKTRE